MINHHQSKFLYLWIFLLSCVFLATTPLSDLCAQEQEDVLLKALKDELSRSVEKLQLKNMEKPYYIEYTVEDTEMLMVKAIFGAVVSSTNSKSRLLKVDVRVGNYDFDNTGFISQRSMYSAFGSRPRQIVLENDYMALRQDVWLATDATYKRALEQLAEKQSFIKTKVQEEEIPDFSHEEVITSIAPRKSLEYDKSKWEKVLRSLSDIFREFPAIYDSGITLFLKVTNKYFINSEGTMIRQPVTLFSLYARASTQAPDGMQLKHFVPFYGTYIEQLPSQKEMTAAIRKISRELTALTSAPVLENYLGPVLVTGEAASEVFAQVLAPQLSGDRPPLIEQQRMAAMIAESKLASRLDRRVLPSFFTVVDDPTQTTLGKHPFIGAYKVDDQGVPTRPVTLIDRGVLKTLLMSRRPRKEISQSNGHGRSMPFVSPSAQIGNLFIKTTEGKTITELKQDLIELCKDQGLSYGLLIKKLDNPSITGRDLTSSSYMMRGGQQKETITAPLMVYKVYVENGREELVRGLTVEEMSVRTLKDIVAAGSNYYVNNRLTAGGGLKGLSFSLVTPVTGIPTTAIAPSVLFEELELKKPSGPQQKPALLKHPFFSK